MITDFKQIPVRSFDENVVKLIGDEWMLLSAGDINNHNMMTASWGTIGVLWNKPVASIFVRPQRYTYEFVEKHEFFSLNFFAPEYKQALNFCGTKSGRDFNKSKETGLTPVESAHGAVYFAQARLVLVCKKIYFNDIQPQNFLDQSIAKNYPLNDYHRMYVAEIVQVLSK